MSSEDKGCGPGDHGGGGSVGEAKVLELTEEEKKESMLSDLESGKCLVSSRTKSACSDDKNATKSTAGKRRGRDWAKSLEEVRAGKRRLLRSDVAKLRAAAEASKKKNAEVGGCPGALLEGNDFDINMWNGSDWVQCGEDFEVEQKGVLRPDVAEQSEEFDARIRKPHDSALLSDDKHGSSSLVSTSSDVEMKECEQADTDEKKLTDVDTDKKKLTEEANAIVKNNREEVGLDKERPYEEAGIIKKETTEVANSDKKVTEDFDSGEKTDEAEIDGKKVGEEAATDEKEVSEEADSGMIGVMDCSKKKITEHVASGACQHGNSSANSQRNREEQIARGDDFEVDMMTITGSNSAHQREAADAKIAMVEATSGPKRNIEKSTISKSKGKGWMEGKEVTTVEKQRIMVIGVATRKNESGTEKKEFIETVCFDEQQIKQITVEADTEKEIKEETTFGILRHGKSAASIGGNHTVWMESDMDIANKRQETKIDAKDVKEVACGVDYHRKNSITGKRNATDQVKCVKEFKVEKRITRSFLAKQREEADAEKRRVEEEDGIAKEKAAEVDGLGAYIIGNNPSIRKRNGAKKITREEVKNVGKNQIVGFDVAMQSEEAGTENMVTKEVSSTADHADDAMQIECIEIRLGKKKIIRSNNVNQGEEADTLKKEVLEDAAPEVDQNMQRSTISELKNAELLDHDEAKVEKKRVLRSDISKRKEMAETFSDEVVSSVLERTRRRGTSDATRKKIKAEPSKCRQEQSKECDGKKLKLNSSKAQGLEPREFVPVTKVKNTMLPKATKISSSELAYSNPGTRMMLKDNKTCAVSVRRQEFGVSHCKSTNGQGREGVLMVVPSSMKTDEFKQAQIQKEDEENRNIAGPPNGRASRSKCPSLSVSRKILNKALGAKVKHKSSSPQKEMKTMRSLKRKTTTRIKGEGCSTSEVLVPSKQKKNVASAERSTARQKLRDQIKTILLNAGWKIDLRPRKGKNYNDSVYISPHGGSGYWSITKAYEVFESQCRSVCADKGKNKSRSSKTSKKSHHSTEGSGSPFPAIAMEALSMLKKTILHRRKSKKVLEECKKKRGDGSKSKRSAQTASTKHPKGKHAKDNGGEIKGKTKVKNISKQLVPAKDKKNKRGCTLLVRGSNQEAEAGTDGYVPYAWKRTVLSWMIDSGVVPGNCRVKCMDQQSMLEGQITRDGIDCKCCSRTLTASNFEMHAGSKMCRPYQNIFVEEGGISLLQCLIDAWKRQDELERQSFFSIDTDGDDPNDDTCGICGDGGDLICCDGCPSTFHLNCLGIEMLPSGEWHCMNCSCRFCGVLSGFDAEENSGYVSPLLTCSQCEKKYHAKCIRDVDALSASSSLFCGESCQKLFEQLQRLLGVKNEMEAGFSWSIVQRFDEDILESVCGLYQRAECNSKIAVAFAVMDECFLPIIDQRSGINLIHNVVYNCGSNFHRLNFRGFYTFILEQGDEIISAASLRIRGTRLAEMPFIGTQNRYRRQGMCRRLLSGIESALCSLNVEKLIIPAISELTDTWTNVFGFKPLEISQKQEVRSLNILVFPGTGLLQKQMLKKDSAEHRKPSGGGEVVPESWNHQTPEAANETSLCVSRQQASEDFIVQHKDEAVKEKSRTNSVCSTSDESLESSDASHKSKLEAQEYKPPQDAVGGCLLLHVDAAYLDKKVVANDPQGESSSEPETEFPVRTLPDESKVPIGDGAAVNNLLPVNETSGEHTFNSKFSSQHVDSDLQESGAMNATDLPANDDSVLRHHIDFQSTSPHASCSILLNTSGNNVHISTCASASSSDATYRCRCGMTNNSTTVFPIEHGFQLSKKCSR